MPFALWITGLPGSGKSAIAKELMKTLRKNKIKAEILSMDALRKKIVKNQKYTDEERDFAYKKFVDIGLDYIRKNKNIILDATAHKKKYRDYARKKIKSFSEVYVKCPIEVCVERETKRKQSLVKKELYKKALERKKSGKLYKGLGEIIGIDIPYEESKAELIINSEKLKPKESALKVFRLIKQE